MDPQKKKRKLLDGRSKVVGSVQNGLEPAEAAEEKDQRRSLFVRSLPASVTKERLAELFSQSFPVKHATVVVDSATKISKGYGFVTYTDAEDAQAAAEELNNTSIDGRKIKVEVAESRQRDIEDGERKGVNTTAGRLKAARDEQRQDAQPPRLIVRNLPWSIKDGDDLTKLFLSYGRVKHAVVPRRSPRMQYGFGIVILRGKKNAEKALEGVNGKEVDGRVLAVDWAVDKKTWEQIQQDETQQQNEGISVQPKPDDSATAPADPVGEDEEEGSETMDADMDELDSSEIPPVPDTVPNEVSNEDSDDALKDEPVVSEDAEKSNPDDTTVFVRNLPYEVDDETLKEHFQNFGPVRYARVVYDPSTERSRGTGFVCFFNDSDAKECVKSAPKKEPTGPLAADKKRRGETVVLSVLQNDAEDPSGKFTVAGRVLQVSRALSKGAADQRADEASDKRLKRDGDKRRLYLLGEGTISKTSKLYERLGKAEIDVRENSARQRQKLIKTNPNLCLSLTRLSIRNIPRHVDSKELKALAREAIVGFFKDVSEGVRQPLSKEELRRGGDAMKDAEKRRKEKGVGVVMQSKVVFEGREGSKVKDGAGRSRGYGFIEYYTHRNALAGLRWLNGHLVKPKEGSSETPKRLIVEFAIENAQVVQRRTDREKQVLDRGYKKREEDEGVGSLKRNGTKRKRLPEEKKVTTQPVPTPTPDDKNSTAKRNRIIAKKRASRKVRKG